MRWDGRVDFRPAVWALAFFAAAAQAATRYVWTNSPSPGAGYASWSTAAHTIQEAVDAAADGDTVLVTNGTYAAGSRTTPDGSSLNRIVVTNAVTVRSVNGPELTVIAGRGPLETNAVRCAYLANGAVLSGFTLSDGRTSNPDRDVDRHGGGVYAFRATIARCIITGNAATAEGGGIWGGTVNNCVVSANKAEYGGGACRCKLNACLITGNKAVWEGGGVYRCTANSCTVVGNSADYGGGAYGSDLRNSIVYHNFASLDANYFSGSYAFCCITPLPQAKTNIPDDPQLASVYRLATNSPCIGAGIVDLVRGTDMDGETWSDPPCMGCDQVVWGAVTGEVTVAIVAPAAGPAVGRAANFVADIRGKVTQSEWNFGDGTTLTNRPFAAHAWSVAGDYRVVLRAWNETCPEGKSAAVTVCVTNPPAP